MLTFKNTSVEKLKTLNGVQSDEGYKYLFK